MYLPGELGDRWSLSTVQWYWLPSLHTGGISICSPTVGGQRVGSRKPTPRSSYCTIDALSCRRAPADFSRRRSSLTAIGDCGVQDVCLASGTREGRYCTQCVCVYSEWW